VAVAGVWIVAVTVLCELGEGFLKGQDAFLTPRMAAKFSVNHDDTTVSFRRRLKPGFF
jgi:hypothetical protein